MGAATAASLPEAAAPATDTASSTDTTAATGTESSEAAGDGSIGGGSDATGDTGDEGVIGDSGTNSANGSDNSGVNGSDNSSDNSDNDSGSTGSTGSPTTLPATDGTTAAGRFAWGTAQRGEDFAGDLSAWDVYDGPGQADKGRRSPSAVSVANGILTISGDANGTTGGLSWGSGARSGRWEARVESPVADPTYHAVMLLWPDAENFPVGGEVDFMEISDAARQKADFFLHYGASNQQLQGKVAVDATQWHNWAVEWAPDHITAYVDGQQWYTTTRTDAFPPGPMHLTLQLDWFPKDGGAVTPSTMQVDWVRYYPIDGSGPSGAIVNSDGTTTTAATTVSTAAGATSSTSAKAATVTTSAGGATTSATSGAAATGTTSTRGQAAAVVTTTTTAPGG
jgi:Glycosyl hydrolases family 16